MSEYKKLYEYGPDWEATQIVIDRSGSDRALAFSIRFKKNDEISDLKFDRPDNTSNIVELIDVEHVIVSRRVNSQQEYGNIKVEFLGDSWSEVWCDAVQETRT